MAEQQEITLDDVRSVAARAGMNLNDEELRDLHSAYSMFAPQVATLHEIDLDDGDLAVTFIPDWDPES